VPNEEAKTEEILIQRLESGQLNSRADLHEVERIARDRGLKRLARRASRERRKLRRTQTANVGRLLRQRRSQR
jgi:hypothetical protein